MPLPKATACIPAMTPSTKAWRGQIAPTLTPRGLFLLLGEKIKRIGIQRSKLIGLMSSYVCMSHHPYMWSPLDAVRVLSVPSVWHAACRWIESERSKTHRWRKCSAWGKCLGYRATKSIIQNWKETKSVDWTLPCGAYDRNISCHFNGCTFGFIEQMRQILQQFIVWKTLQIALCQPLCRSAVWRLHKRTFPIFFFGDWKLGNLASWWYHQCKTGEMPTLWHVYLRYLSNLFQVFCIC